MSKNNLDDLMPNDEWSFGDVSIGQALAKKKEANS